MQAAKTIQLICVTLCLAIIVDAKIYSKCEFAQTLAKHGITDRSHLGTWTCIASHESNFNTKAINTKSGDYGILQINHYYWCSDTNVAGKGCHITCKSLLGDDITPDIKCAKTVYDETAHQSSHNGFTAWTTYKAYCLGDQTHWIAGCTLD